MRFGEIEVTASLNRNGSAYSFQEDVLLKVRVRNLGDSDAVIPYLNTHPANWELKNLVSGEDKTIVFATPHSPGTPNLGGLPEAVASPAQDHVYDLTTQIYLGVLKPGKYSMRYSLKSPSIPFKTDWMDFTVLDKNVDFFSSVPSVPGLAQRLHLAWRDRGAVPTRMLLQISYIGQNKPLASRVVVVGEGEAESSPIPSQTPSGRDPGKVWVGWVAKDKLRLAKVDGKGTIVDREFDIPEKGIRNLVPFLIYSEDPGGANPRLSGGLIGYGEGKSRLVCFQSRDSGDIRWFPPLPLPAGDILAIRLVPFNRELGFFFWLRHTGGMAIVEAMAWDAENGIAKQVKLGELPLEVNAFKYFEATTDAENLVWGVIFQSEASKKFGKIDFWSHSLVGETGKSSPGIPKVSRFPARVGPIKAQLKFDSNLQPWILQRDVHGAWVQSHEFNEPIPVESPRGSQHESLFFRRGELPRVSLFNPDTGFETRIVSFPGSGIRTDEDGVDDEQ